jgi:dTDP-4-amino-4,6-dideoxy-D-galactose acyltransferase
MSQPGGTGAAHAAEEERRTPPCRLLAWDTEFWGQRIARVEEGRITPARISAVDAWCGESDVACVFLLVEAGDRTATLAAEGAGFFFTDVRVTMTADVVNRRGGAGHSAIRPARSEDRERLMDLARVSHRITRFFHDPHFDDERCAELYARWLSTSFEGAADKVIVVESGGVPAGYVTCELEDGGATGRIGLIAVDPESQGRGLGSALCEAALDWFAGVGAAAVEIVTQGRNVAAQRVFQRAGARTTGTELWFHKWYAEADTPARDPSVRG